jgi:hypothetical protein
LETGKKFFYKRSAFGGKKVDETQIAKTGLCP